MVCKAEVSSNPNNYAVQEFLAGPIKHAQQVPPTYTMTEKNSHLPTFGYLNLIVGRGLIF